MRGGEGEVGSFVLFGSKVSPEKPGYVFPYPIYLTFSPCTTALESFSSIPEHKHNTSAQEQASADKGLHITT